MKILAGIAVSMAAVMPVFAATDPQSGEAKACITRAAEFLPRIPNIEIKASRTVDVPAEVAAKVKPDPGVLHAIVEIDAKAVGQDTTYRFLCVVRPGAPLIVQRIQ